MIFITCCSAPFIGHLVLFLICLRVFGTQWFLSLAVHIFCFCFWFPAIFCWFWHCRSVAYSHLVLVITTIVLVFFVPYVKLVLPCHFLSVTFRLMLIFTNGPTHLNLNHLIELTSYLLGCESCDQHSDLWYDDKALFLLWPGHDCDEKQ